MRGDYLIKKTYYSNGQIWESFDWTSGKEVFEDYEEDGKPGLMSRQKLAAAKEREEQEKKNALVKKADSLLMIGLVDDAISSYKKLSVYTNELERFQNNYNIRNESSTSFQTFLKIHNVNYSKSDFGTEAQLTFVKTKLGECKDLFNKSSELEINLGNKLKEYENLYVEQKQTIFVDANNKPVMKTVYPKGEYLYQKSKLIIDDAVNEFKAENIGDKKIAKGDLALELLEKLIKLGQGETKDINKQLKKVEDKTEIKTILGL